MSTPPPTPLPPAALCSPTQVVLRSVVASAADRPSADAAAGPRGGAILFPGPARGRRGSDSLRALGALNSAGRPGPPPAGRALDALLSPRAAGGGRGPSGGGGRRRSSSSGPAAYRVLAEDRVGGGGGGVGGGDENAHPNGPAGAAAAAAGRLGCGGAGGGGGGGPAKLGARLQRTVGFLKALVAGAAGREGM
jgi:hypothetical protein